MGGKGKGKAVDVREEVNRRDEKEVKRERWRGIKRGEEGRERNREGRENR